MTMKKTHFILCLIITAGLLLDGCPKACKEAELLRHYPIDDIRLIKGPLK